MDHFKHTRVCLSATDSKRDSLFDVTIQGVECVAKRFSRCGDGNAFDGGEGAGVGVGRHNERTIPGSNEAVNPPSQPISSNLPSYSLL